MDRKAFLKIPVMLAALIAALGALTLTDGCVRGPRIVVGSKNFGEQILLGEIASQQIERRLHVIVERKLEIGGTLLAHEALVKGEIDLYPEYTGTALTAILKQPANDDPPRVLAAVREGYRRWGLRWSEPLGFNNTFAMVIRQADAEARHVATLSDAGVYQRGWELGAGYEFIERPDGLKGLARTYGLRLREQPRTMDLGLLYAAMEEGSVDMVAGNATDGQLTSPQFVALKDDRHYFPPYQAAYVVRDATLGKFPKLEAALRELSGKLDDKRMRELNYQLEGLHRSGPKVVAEWLSKMDGAK